MLLSGAVVKFKQTVESHTARAEGSPRMAFAASTRVQPSLPQLDLMGCSMASFTHSLLASLLSLSLFLSLKHTHIPLARKQGQGKAAQETTALRMSKSSLSEYSQFIQLMN